MGSLDQFQAVQERIFPLIEKIDTHCLSAEERAFLIPFVELQLGFCEAIYDLASLPDAETTGARFLEIRRWFVIQMIQVAERGVELSLSCEDQIRAIALQVVEIAKASILLLDNEDCEDLPPGLDAVFADLRERPHHPDSADLLRTWGISPTDPAMLGALFHVLDRPPHRGEVPHWKVVAERNPAGFRDKWLGVSASRCKSDFERRTVLPSVDRNRADIEAHVAASQSEAAATADAEAVVLSDDDLESANAFLTRAALSPRQREVLVRHRIYGEKLVDIAADSGLADSTVRQHLHRAEKKLKVFKPTLG